MATSSVAEIPVVDTARSALGPVGVYLPLPFGIATSSEAQRETVGRLERAGYRAAWTNEALGGKDALVQLAVLLAIAAKVAEHKAAGADHVTIMPTADDLTAGLAQLEELAPALVEISR